VAAALKNLFPEININNLKHAIRSSLGENQRIHLTAVKPSEPNVVHAAVDRLLKQESKNQGIIAELVKWHDQTARRLYRDPLTPVELPEELNRWLLSKPGLTQAPKPPQEPPVS
jgi:hypothetical protein